MQTYNQIIQLNREFATAHYQIKTFGNGAAYNIVLHDKESWFEYPLMWVEDLPATLNNNEFQFNFRVYFIAQVAQLKDKATDLDSTNENEVKSDMIQCAQDLLSFWAQDITYPELDLIKTGNSFTTITDKFSDMVTGCYIDLKLKQGFRYNKCAIPMSGITPPPSVVCLPATITVNTEDFQEVASGGTLDVTVEYQTSIDNPIASIDGDKIIIVDPIPLVCDPAIITINSNAFESVNSGDTLDVEIEYQTSLDNPIASIVGNKVLINDPIVIPTPLIYQRPIPTGEVYLPSNDLYPDGCDSWQTFNDVDPFEQPLLGIPMLLVKGNHTQLRVDNVFNSRHRFTGLSGGYVDFSTRTYHLIDGTAVTQAEAFPFGLIIDHHTGLRWTNGQIGTTNYTWYQAFTEVAGHSQGGYSDYFVPDQKKLDSIFNLNYQAAFGSAGDTNPLFTADITNGSKWTSSTVKGVETRAFTYQTNGVNSAGTLKTGITRIIGFAFHF
jgi:hypothetical protein